ncbi:MAG: asparagine synthase (glutamine-hydrolyzing) [Nitrospirota bacterium]|nr:asparagine synthase (glutamine-hydrolyzing) [Nitrospirota bacterium]
MCGIAGIFNLYDEKEISMDTLRKMTAIIRHRGPDGFGFYKDKRAGLAHARLSIIDLDGGWQPMHNEDKTIWITFNGEIFNYIELREGLISKGHRFHTKSDTEVIVHSYEEYGTDCLKYFNGQFAFAIWDKNKDMLFIARDRVGIRPLFYTSVNGSILFASEIKSLFADERVRREIDHRALDQIFTFWMNIPPRTAFKDIMELPAGHYMTVKNGDCRVMQYWDLDFTACDSIKSEEEYAEELRELLISSTRLRLRADVSVGAYLSGGIDSSVITALIKKYTNNPLRTFSVAFHDEAYDESIYQKHMIEYLNTDHSEIRCSYSDIGSIFPDVIWHTEMPVLRTAPAPLYLLSKLVRENGYKVVLTGEGADEILAGYDIFKETKVRRFLEKNPASICRPLILKKLYPYLENSPTKSLHYSKAFFDVDMSNYPDRYYSHVPRWDLTSKIKFFFSDNIRDELNGYNKFDELSSLLSNNMDSFDHLSKAQYLEIRTLLSNYLLSSQGDRMAMGNSVEGRYPFLDYRVIEFCCKLPPNLRMRTLTEKYILKKSMNDLLPESIIARTKQPYMAPDSRSFFAGGTLDYVGEMFSENALKRCGCFDVRKTKMIFEKCRKGLTIGFKDNMAFVGILSTQILYDLFVERFKADSLYDKNISNERIMEVA